MPAPGEAEFAEVPYPMTATPFMRPPRRDGFHDHPLHWPATEAGLHEVPGVAWAERSGSRSGGSDTACRRSFCGCRLATGQGQGHQEKIQKNRWPTSLEAGHS